MREGPRLQATCYGCRYYEWERYNVQGDVGYDRFCKHPSHGQRKIIPDAHQAVTPNWCPCLTNAQQRIAELEAERDRQYDQNVEQIKRIAELEAVLESHGAMSTAVQDTVESRQRKRIAELAAENERLRSALTQITKQISHRNPCCPTNPAKNIARRALAAQEQEDA